MSKEPKKYRLLKDLPKGKIGNILTWSHELELYLYYDGFKPIKFGFGQHTYGVDKETVENSPEWFQEIKEEPSRIEVIGMDNFDMPEGVPYNGYKIYTQGAIPEEKIAAIKQLLEDYLNGEGVWSKIKYRKAGASSYDGPKVTDIMWDEHPMYKTYPRGEAGEQKEWVWTDELVEACVQCAIDINAADINLDIKSHVKLFRKNISKEMVTTNIGDVEARKQWEIYSFKDSRGAVYVRTKLDWYENPKSGGGTQKHMMDCNYTIAVVKRLSDKEYFTIGDEVITNEGRGKHKINGFKIIDGDLCADMNTFLTKYEFISKIQKSKA